MGRTGGFELGGVSSHWYWELDGADVDIPRLEEAWNRLVWRHEMLRAVFDDDGRQRILRTVPRTTIRVREAPADAPGPACRSCGRRCRTGSPTPASGLSSSCGPSVTASEPGSAFSFDYIVLDALSINDPLLRNWARLYEDPDADLPPIGLSFRDYGVIGDHQAPASSPQPRSTGRERAGGTSRLAPQGLRSSRDPSGGREPAVRAEGRRGSRAETVGRPSKHADEAESHSPRRAVLAAAYAEVLGAWSTRRGPVARADPVRPEGGPPRR